LRRQVLSLTFLVIFLAVVVVLFFLLNNRKPKAPAAEINRATAGIIALIPFAPLNPVHGIHAPVGFRWNDAERTALYSFADRNGLPRSPGLVLALSADLLASGNSRKISMERDLLEMQRRGTQIYIRLYPQRFPGGLAEKPDSARNTISGSPEDFVEDIIGILKAQQTRTGTHFTRLIPGNEPNLEWPNDQYYQNVLAWRSNDDPTKYEYINRYYLRLYEVWEQRLRQPDAASFQDVLLYFPAIGQDGHPRYFGGYYFYENDLPAGNKLDRLRPAISRYPGFSWHNYWRPGKAWEDRAIVHFPEWLKQKITSGALSAVITEAGWSPDSMAPPLTEEQRNYYQLWRGPTWSYLGPIPVPGYNQDSILNGARFEDELIYFIEQCSGAAYERPAAAQGVAVWLTSSPGNFSEAEGIEKDGKVRRWFESFAGWKK
jgi:hypothetical protein